MPISVHDNTPEASGSETAVGGGSGRKPSLWRRVAEFFHYAETREREDVPADQRARSVRVSLTSSAFSRMFNTGITGPALVGMLRALGAEATMIGLLTGAGHLGKMLQPMGSYFLSRSRTRKRLFMNFTYVGRSTWFVITALAFFLPPGQATVAALLGLVLCSRLADSMGYPAWYSWMSDLVPEEQHGNFWGSRQMVGHTFGLLSALALNFYLGDSPPFHKFIVFFGIVATMGWLDIFLHRSIVGVRMEREGEKQSLWAILSEPFQDRVFRPILIFGFVFSVACSLSGGIFQLMLLEEIDLSYFEISIYISGLLGGISIIASKLWGRLIDNIREGNRLVFYVTSAVAATTPWLWIVTPAREHGLIALNFMVGGIGWSGWHIAALALVAAYSPRSKAAAYMSLWGVVNGVGNMLGATLGGVLADAFVDINATWGPVLFTPMRTVYFLSGLARASSLLLLPFIHKPGSRPIGVFVRQVFSLNPFQQGTYVYIRKKLSARSEEGET